MPMDIDLILDCKCATKLINGLELYLLIVDLLVTINTFRFKEIFQSFSTFSCSKSDTIKSLEGSIQKQTGLNSVFTLQISAAS